MCISIEPLLFKDDSYLCSYYLARRWHFYTLSTDLYIHRNKYLTYVTIDTGRMVTSLVREFLQFFDLEYTLAVFDPEIGLVCIP